MASANSANENSRFSLLQPFSSTSFHSGTSSCHRAICSSLARGASARQAWQLCSTRLIGLLPPVPHTVALVPCFYHWEQGGQACGGYVQVRFRRVPYQASAWHRQDAAAPTSLCQASRSEERRVGKEWRSR